MALYRFFAAELLPDPTSGYRRVREMLPLSDVTYSVIHNRAGSAAAKIDLRSPQALRNVLDPGRTALFIERDGAIKWGGVLWAAIPSDDGTADLRAQGFHSIPAGPGGDTGRFLLHRRAWAAEGQCDIARDLWTYLQDESIHGPGANVGVTVTAGLAGTPRDRTWEPWERHKIGKLIEDLCDVDGGISFRFAHSWQGSGTTRHIETELIVTEGIGRRLPYVWRLGRNLRSISLPIDATGMARRVHMLGEGQGPDQVSATRSSLAPGYPLMETVEAGHSSVIDAGTLQAHADSLLTRRAYPTELPNLVARPGPDPRLSSFLPGEDVRVIATLDGAPTGGLLDVDGYYRIAGYTVSVGETDRDPTADSREADEDVTVELSL